MEEHHKYIENFLGTCDKKYTSQRRAIVDQIFELHGHFEVEAFISAIRTRHTGVSRATVYRTIGLLLEANVLKKIPVNDGKVYYEHILGHTHHDHLICTVCGKVIEISDERLEDIQEKTCRNVGFIPAYHILQIYGRCSDCGA